MRILFISDNFPPEVNAPASRTYEHTKRWVENGIAVTVITCAPNFPKGKVHDGYKNRWRLVEYVDGIRVVRVKSFITGNEGFALRVLDYVSFMLSALFFGLFEKRPDVIIGTSPQFFAAAGAWMLSVAKWRPFVFELRDLWPASIVTVGAMKRGLAIRLLEKLELFLYRRATLIVSVTRSFKNDLVRRGIEANKIVIIRNGVDLSQYEPRPKSAAYAKELGVADKFVVAYLGTHGMAHALENVITSAQLLQNDKRINFLFVGHGADKHKLQQMAAYFGLENVIFRDIVPKSKMPELWSVCDVALVHLKDDPVFATVIPSKIFEAFGVGKPILIVAPKGEAAEIVLDAHAGDWVPPEDPAALAEKISAWLDDPDRVSRYAAASAEAAQENSRDLLASNMLDKIQSVVA